MSRQGDTVRIKFVVEGGKDVNDAIATQVSLIESLRSQYERANSTLSVYQSGIEKFRAAGFTASDDIQKGFLKAEQSAKGFAEQVRVAENEMERLQQIAKQQLQSNFQFGQGQFPGNNVGQFNIPLNPQAFGSPNSVAGINNAVQGLNQASLATTSLTAKQQSLNGVTLIGTTLLRQFGVEGARGIEVVGRQMLLLVEEGKGAKEIFEILNNSKLLGFTVLAAAGIAALETIKGIVDNIRASTESTLRSVEALNKVSLIGQTGGRSQVESDLKKLEQAKKDFEFFVEKGRTDRAAEILRTELGGGANAEALAKAQADLDRAIRNKGFGRLGIGGTSEEDIRKAREEFEKALGGFSSPELLNKRLKDIRADVAEFELAAFSRGDRDNIFDKTEESLRNLAETTGRTGDLKNFILDLRNSAKDGSDLFAHASDSILRFKQSLEATHDQQKETTRLNERLREEFAKVNKELDLQARFHKELDALQKKGTDNPLLKVLESAASEAEKIKKEFSSLGSEAVKSLTDANNKIVNLEIFKLDLSARLNVGKLQSELAKLNSGLFGNTRQQEEEDRLRIVNAKIREARDSNDFPALRQAQAELSGITGGLRQQIEDANRSGKFVQGAELENKLLAFTREENRRLFNQNNLDSELNLLTSKLGIAANVDAQKFVLDKILELTSNIQELTAPERDIRANALQQRVNLGEAEKHRVLIEIKNNSEFATTKVEEILGEEPNPNSGNSTNQTNTPFYARGIK